MAKIGLITALRSEAACLTRHPLAAGEIRPISDDFVLVLSGMGEQNVQRAISSLANHGVDGLVSFGTAGALDAALHPGTVVLAKEVMNEAGTTTRSDAAWQGQVLEQLHGSGMQIACGKLYCPVAVVNDPASKRRIHADTDAIAVDMESAQVLKAAAELGLPGLSVRVIVDSVAMAIPPAVLASTDAYGDTRLPALLAALARQPGLLGELLALARAFALAKKSMRGLGENLHQLFLPLPGG